MESPFGKVFYLSSFALGSFIAKSLLDQYGTLPFHLFYSSIEVHSYDEAYNYLMFWLMKEHFNENKSHLIASTSLNSEMYDGNDTDKSSTDDLYPDQTVDAEWKASLANTRPLLWTPSTGTHRFRFMGRNLALTREVEERGTVVYTRTEKLRISCLGWDSSALKQLMLEARLEFSQKEKGKTVIYRGTKRYEEFIWTRSTSRPARPLSTVLLEEDRKHDFIQDVQQYLHPATMKWYGERGIPYRRGYLFYGPPGTGKSSLAFAAAGFLGLNVYILNLGSQQLTEDALAQLFQDLPRRCLVLLEDIDSNEVTSRRTKKKRKGRNNLTLSALLNLIDGVAAQEGRVLIMTTNHHEHLDPALIRPGRVDFQLEFKLTNRSLTMQMFQNIFCSPHPNIDLQNKYNQNELAPLNQRDICKFPTSNGSLNVYDPPSLSDADIDELARAFGETIPEYTFSPAQIQGFLLGYKTSPEHAIANAEAWVQKTRNEQSQRVVGEVEEIQGESNPVEDQKESDISGDESGDQESSDDDEEDATQSARGC
ncbi:hypothetical protein EYZ11_000626 [Aspergillus tanneri]|uniref:BCS1 N-terminal domain-containing protein n=1 Tax=Aspergillus tanneri TaxID=1220188 RepID=A0A4S3JWQ6_9EURO|nr:uncharacterized protein ATNIH1004_007670 [Aspergillus tanneri]KAA8646243.1 hypothetical protein ATNIH1004_007670 [Aspergillus tanneri]THC99928.1 hypothetical protein EYZ11_000626 [Aspergillus tanneri]